jgi:hypothetical protein
MKKPQGREGAADSETQEPRKLNMEEKRKLEKLLLSDIDSAVARYNAQAEDMRGNLIDKLTKNPPADAKKLFDSYSLEQKQVGQLKSKLEALGFDIAYDGALRVNTHGTTAAQLKAFDALARKMRELLQTLKRSYVIKLFADHADTQSLFASLARDLEHLIGRQPRHLTGGEGRPRPGNRPANRSPIGPPFGRGQQHAAIFLAYGGN